MKPDSERFAEQPEEHNHKEGTKVPVLWLTCVVALVIATTGLFGRVRLSVKARMRNV